MTTTTSRPTFTAVTAVTATGAGTFTGAVSPDWTIGDRANGGYLLAVMGRAATATCPHDHVFAASAHFLWSPEPGPVTVTAEVLRAGRSASQVRARMRQDERDCVEALFTVGRVGRTVAPQWDVGTPATRDVAFESSVRLVPRLPNGAAASIMEQIAVHLDADSNGFVDGEPSGRGELHGWLSLPDDEPFDPVSLLFAVDAFPPATFDIAFTGWVPTLELTAYVRALPEPGPLRVQHRAQLIDDGRVDEMCLVWDRTGRLVAQATQLALIRLD
jgi:acyl-coenzyme A thioesterase PaaI-like protein